MSKVETSWVANFVDNVTPKVSKVEEAGKEAAEAVSDIGKEAQTMADEVGKSSTAAAGDLNKVSTSADDLQKNIKKISAVEMKMAADAVRDLTNQFSEAMSPGQNFEVSLKEVQSVTHQSNEEMEGMAKAARDLAKQFGGDASAQLESFGSVVARFGPGVAKDDAAMKSMGESIATTSKLMKGDAVGAMDALTTAMLQFGVDVNNPKVAAAEMARMMNVMAAAGNEGSSEVADTGEALKQVGIVAHQAGLSFEDTNAALQGLAQGGRKGAEAGVSLRNVLSRMEGLDIIPRRAREKIKELGVDFNIISNKSLPFITRLKELSKVQGDATLTSMIFGVENMAAAKVLFQTIDYQEKVKDAITGTNAAQESASIVMESQTEKISRMNAWVNDLKISFFNVAGSMTPFIVGLGAVAFTIANTAAAITGISQLIGFIKSLTIVTQLQTAAQWAFNMAQSLSPTTWIIAGIVALIAVVVVAWNKFEGFRKVVLGTWEVMKGFGTVIKEYVIDLIQGMLSGIGSIGQAIAKLFTGDFSGAWDSAKAGVKDLTGFTALKNAYTTTGQTNWGDLYTQGTAGAISSKDKNKAVSLGASFGRGGTTQAAVSPTAVFQQTGSFGGAAQNQGGSGISDTKGGKKGGKTSQNGTNLSASGSSAGRTIVMTVNNYISGFKGTDELAQEVARKINGRLSDGLAAVG